MEISGSNPYDQSFDTMPTYLSGSDTEDDEPPLRRNFTVSAFDSDYLQNIPPRVNELGKKKLKRAREDFECIYDIPLIEETKRFTSPFHLDTTSCSEQGKRPSMEDCHLDLCSQYGRFIAVFDGHGTFSKRKAKQGKDQNGLVIAKKAAQSAKNHLINCFRDYNFEPKGAFNAWAKKTHESLPFKNAGTTAAIAFIEKVSGILHVASIGDTNIVVLREDQGYIYAIPMSPIVNWETPKCVEKVRKILTKEEFEKWQQLQGKQRRFGGLNVAASLGDAYATEHGKCAITRTPVCSQLQLRPTDRILCACDGLFDFVPLPEIEELFANYWNEPNTNFAELAVDLALKKNSTDNVTVVVATMIEGREPENDLSSTVILE